MPATSGSPSDEQSIRTLPPQVNVAKALQELDRGEKTATAMEEQLARIERTIEDLLARVEGEGHEAAGGAAEKVDGVNGVNGSSKA